MTFSTLARDAAANYSLRMSRPSECATSARMLGMAAAVALAVLSGASSEAQAQGVISNGSATFERSGTAFDGSPSGNLTGVSSTLSQDHLFDFGWWYRVSGQTSESVFGTPISQFYVGDTSTIGWTNVGGLGLFNALETATVTDTGVGGHVIASMMLTNTTQTFLTLSLFNYLDMDLAGAGSDSATLLGADLISITDPSGNTGRYQGAGASAFQVQSFATLRTALNDAAITNFNSSGLPFGPGDFTGGFQWDFSIAPGASIEARVLVAVNDDTNLNVPEPGTLALLGLGIAGLAASRKRKR